MKSQNNGNIFIFLKHQNSQEAAKPFQFLLTPELTRSHKTFSISYNNTIHKKPHKTWEIWQCKHRLTHQFQFITTESKKKSLTIAIL